MNKKDNHHQPRKKLSPKQEEQLKNQLLTLLQRQRGGGQTSPKKKVPWMLIIVTLLLILALFAPTDVVPTEEVPISQIVSEVQDGRIEELTVTNETQITAKLKKDFGGQTLKAEKEPSVSIFDYGISHDATIIKVENNTAGSVALSLALNFLPVLILVGFIYYIARQSTTQNARALSFGQSRAKLANTSRVRFADVAGLKEAKYELTEVVEFLKNPAKFHSIGAEIPKGVILTGPPGTGKTLLAKAVAGEASVPFFSISASEFVEMFVGVGASRVRDLFTQAQKNSPSIIFIDELDAIGRQRGAGLGGSHDEREQTLNQILVEMDGFGTDSRVIVMAATNRPDILDPALLRPGRFDRSIVVDLPTRSEREEILAVHTSNKPLADGVDLGAIAGQTAGFSGADLKNVSNEAAIFTARDDRKRLTQADFHAAVEKVLVGPERSARILNEEEKKITAFHEAGHAVVGHVLPLTDPIHKISIISRGQALGLTWSLPKEDRHLTSRRKFIQDIAMLLGGRLTETMIMGDVTTGASNDLSRATEIARTMVTRLGMSAKLGSRTFGKSEELIFLGKEIHEQRDYSERVAEQIDAEVANIIAEATELAQKTLLKYRAKLTILAEKLMKDETVDGSYLDKLIPLSKSHASKNSPTT